MKKIFLISVLLAAAANADDVSYTYDEAGRLLSADYGGGKAIEYRHNSGTALVSKVIADSTDSEPDGMADAWEMVHFLTKTRDGTGDFDKDGKSDKEEFEAGTDPGDASPRFRVIQVIKVEGSPTFLKWSAVPGKRYIVQYRNDLSGVPWTVLGTEAQATDTSMTINDPGPFVAGKRFYRVMVVAE